MRIVISTSDMGERLYLRGTITLSYHAGDTAITVDGQPGVFESPLQFVYLSQNHFEVHMVEVHMVK